MTPESRSSRKADILFRLAADSQIPLHRHSEGERDRHTLVRLFTARMKFGMFDPPEMVPYSKIAEKELDSPEHRGMALTLANEAMVSLKNDGLLLFKPSGIICARNTVLAQRRRAGSGVRLSCDFMLCKLCKGY